MDVKEFVTETLTQTVHGVHVRTAGIKAPAPPRGAVALDMATSRVADVGRPAGSGRRALSAQMRSLTCPSKSIRNELENP
jgi:hypothetical protein